MPETNIFSKIDDAQTKAKTIEENIGTINMELESLANVLRKLNDNDEIVNLKNENVILKKEITKVKNDLFLAEIWNGVKQYKLQGNIENKNNNGDSVFCNEEELYDSNNKTNKINKNETKPSENKKLNIEISESTEISNFSSHLDMRVGIIKSAEKHPDADSLYVEKIDLGETEPRTIISGLVAHVTINQLIDRKVVVLCNLKPIKMRGIFSQGMLMCAVDGDKLEILKPPPKSVPGDRIIFDGTPQIQAKEIKKDYFAKISPHLKTSDRMVAMLGDKPFSVQGKGLVVCDTLKRAAIR